MAFNTLRSLASVAKCVRSGVKHIPSLSKTVVTQQTNPTLTRSLWHMSKRDHVGSQTTFKSPSLACGCCRNHSTEADKELAEFLQEEIQVEKGLDRSQGKVPRIKGFDISIDGAEVSLTKTSGDENILITFNVNNTVDAEYPMDEQAPTSDDKPPEMVSKPSFLVELNKGGPMTLAIQCAFPPEEESVDSGSQEQYVDLIEIQEVAILPKGVDWDEKTYCVNAEIMDGNLYDLLLNLLEDRGVDAEFADQLIDFSSTLEHKKYIDFLKDLKTFSESQ